MRRVVITGLGIVSCLGNDKATVTENLRNSRPGIRYNPEYKEMGLRSQVSGSIDLNLEELIDRKVYRFVGHAAAYAYLAMQDAIKDAGLTEEQVSNPRTGLVAGSGGASTLNQMEALDTLREKGVKRVGPYRVTRTMGSTVSACLATPFKIKGINYSISSACATSAHCIGTALSRSSGASRTSSSPAAVKKSTGASRSCSMPWAPCRPSATKPLNWPRAPMTLTAMASSSPVVAAWSWSRSWNTPWPVAPRSMPKSSATAQLPTATTWLPRAAKARSAACSRRWPPSTPDRLPQHPRHLDSGR